MTRAIGAALIVLALAAQPAAADHEPVPLTWWSLKFVCAETGRIDHGLRSKYGEAPVARGWTRDGAVMQVYRSEDGGWSITLHYPDGRECLLIGGGQLKKVPWILDKGERT